MTTVSAMRAVLLAAVVAAVAGVAGCGGGATQAGSAFDSGMAALAPASAPLVIALETDPESDQWQQAEELLKRFPGSPQLLDELRKSLSEEGIDAEQDLLPALGDETYVVFLDFEDGGDNVVLLTEPRDPDKLRQLLRESDDPTVTREVDGWTIVAEEEELIDRFTSEGDRLEGADWFNDAQERVEEDALVTFVANGAAIEEASRASVPADCELPETRLDFAAGAMTAEENGVRFTFAASGEGAEAVDGESLLSRVPAGALAYFGSPGLGDAIFDVTDQLRCTTDERGLPDAERFLGVSYEQIAELFAGGFALSARPAAVVPEVTLVLAPEDAAAAVATLDKLAEQATSAGLGDVRSRTVDGVEVKELRAGPVTILYGGADGHVAVSTNVRGLGALTGDLESLRDDDRFRDALDAAGVEDADEVFAYVDIQQVVELADGLAGLAEENIPADVYENLEPLRTLVVWGDVSDANNSEGGAFLEIR